MPLASTFGVAAARAFGFLSNVLRIDEFFEYVTLLLPGNGTNGAQNNTFLDSSTNNFTITRNGNTTQGTFSPFSQTGWGNYFDGSGDYLSVADSTALDLNTTFTVEGWFYQPTAGNGAIFGRGGGAASWSTTDGHEYNAFVSSGLFYWQFNTSGSVTSISATAPAANAWHHFAVGYNGTTTRVWLDGASIGTSTNGYSLPATRNITRVGFTASSENILTGYISNLRVVKGTDVYGVGNTSITVPTAPLTAITNTSLLTCQSNRFIDNSTNNLTITPNGDVSVQAFSPFNPTASWSAATNGGSGYFDGSGDFLTLASNTALDMGTGNFTVEMWVYSTDASVDTQNRRFFATETNGSGSIQLGHVTTTTGVAQYCDNGALGALITGTTNILNQWAHIAAVRSGTTVTLYVNGVSEGTATDSGNKTSTAFTIGKYPGASGHLKGWLGSLRVVKGTAVYTSNFTPPTTPLTAITNTSLLLNFTNGAIYDAAAKNDLETVGNAQISTTQSKWGGSSMYFDGNDDWLYAPAGQNWELGSGDFTVEFWLNPSDRTVNDAIFSKGNLTSVGNEVYTLQWYSTNLLAFFSGGSLVTPVVVTTTQLSTGIWYHVAVTRYNGTTRIFVNGILEASSTTSYTIAQGGPFYVGAGWYDPTTRDLGGYLQDLRITKGVARYTSNFTPPTAPFPVR